MTKVLMISKPIVPPWDDSAKNIVHSQLLHSRSIQYRILGTPSTKAPGSHVTVDPIYADAGHYSPGLKQNVKVMLHGLMPRGADIYHYFFAPNKVTSLAGRVQRFSARVRSVQTVCSQPLVFDGIDRLLFSDKVVVLSNDTKCKMVSAGVDANRIVHVEPGIDPIEALSPSEKKAIRRQHGIDEDKPMVVFPGDYEFSNAAQTVGDAIPLLASRYPELTVVFACRIKREPSRQIRDSIKTKLSASGHLDRVVFMERVMDMPAFVGSADAVLMPAESLYAKMDVPLVLLEAMSQGVPIVVADVPPINELLEVGCGIGVLPQNPQALADAVGHLQENPNEAKRLGQGGAQAVHDLFSAARMAQKMEEIYKEVMAP